MRAAVVDQQWQPVRNLYPNPCFEAVTSLSGKGQNADWARPSVQGAFKGDHVGQITRLNSTVGNCYVGFLLNIQPNTIYVVSLYIRAAVGSPTYQLITAGFSPGATSISLTASDQWQRLSCIFRPSSITNPTLIVRDDGSPTHLSGEAVQIDGLMLTAGPQLYAYADGDSPGWRWEGAPGASTSVGYPRPA